MEPKSVTERLLREHSKVLVYLLVVTGVDVAGIVLVDVILVMTVVLRRLILAGPDVMIEKVVVTPGTYVVTTKMYLPPESSRIVM
jgi:hypothetical protein